MAAGPILRIPALSYQKMLPNALSTLLFILLSPSVRQNKIVHFIFPMRKWASEVLRAVKGKSKSILLKDYISTKLYLQEGGFYFLQVQALYISDLSCLQG